MIPTPQAPETPAIEQPPAPPAPMPQAPIAQSPALPPALPPFAQTPPPVRQPLPPGGWYPTPTPAAPPMIPPSERDLAPSATQRMWLGIVSLVVLVPLLGIAIGFMAILLDSVPAGVAVTVGLLVALVICASVVAVNFFFGYAGGRYRR